MSDQAQNRVYSTLEGNLQARKRELESEKKALEESKARIDEIDYELRFVNTELETLSKRAAPCRDRLEALRREEELKAEKTLHDEG